MPTPSEYLLFFISIVSSVFLSFAFSDERTFSPCVVNENDGESDKKDTRQGMKSASEVVCHIIRPPYPPLTFQFRQTIYWLQDVQSLGIHGKRGTHCRKAIQIRWLIRRSSYLSRDYKLGLFFRKNTETIHVDESLITRVHTLWFWWSYVIISEMQMLME